MTLGDLMTRFRVEVKDTVEPYFWSDASLIAWFNEAQDEACRRAFLLVDSKSAAASAPYLAGAEGVELHPSVIFVRRALLASTRMALAPRVSRTMDEDIPGWENASESVPRVFVPDWQTGYLKFWPPAAAADTLAMTVVRTPLEEMASTGDEPEIIARYQPGLLDWVKYRAYDVQDADTFDPKKSLAALGAFEARFGTTSAVGEHWALEQYYDIGAT